MDKKNQTRQALKQSFLELFANKDITEITVGAITRKAGCNRCTFYNYYNDVQELLEQIEDETLADIKEQFDSRSENDAFQDINTLFESFLSTFEKYENTIFILLSKRGKNGFRQRFRELFFLYYSRIFSGRLDAEQTEYLISYVFSSGIGLIEHWHETGKKYSAEDFLRLMETLVMTGVFGYVHPQNQLDPQRH